MKFETGKEKLYMNNKTKKVDRRNTSNLLFRFNSFEVVIL